jgi:hypothetical protein
MAPFFTHFDSRPRRSREAARRRERASELKLESLEPRLALASLPAALDAKPPRVQSVSLPAAGTYGTGSELTFKLNFNEPVRVLGDRAHVVLPVEVNYAMRSAAYVAGSGTKSLTFRMTVTANDVDTDGISLGRVNETSVRDFDFATDQIKDRAGNSASDAIPAVNTSRIRVDATGPVVAGVGGFVTRGRNVSLKVTFDGPVTVTGRPTVPVTIDGVERELAYVAGSKTSTLTFAVKVPRGESVASPTFRGTNGLPGEVILLPKTANLKDRLGNSVTPIGGNFGTVFTDDGTPHGNRVVVIGTHYEALRTEDRRVTIAELSEILTSELDAFNPPSNADTPLYWKEYTNPTYPTPTNDVDLYRVAYRSTIPEQGNRPTISYGLVAIPHGATGKLPVVSYQHGTLFFKESAPSQAFSWDKNSTADVKYGFREKDFYDSCYETRLNVAQFAGNGYVVIAADFFGIGNSVENDSFFVKGSEQQACLGMHSAALGLLASKGLVTEDLDLFLNGWSQGGLVTLSFQEALEARGVRINGVSTASAPSHTDMFAERFIFNPRSYSNDGDEVPDAEWSVFIHQFSSFALGGYTGQTNAPLELLGGNYELSRKFYMREFVNYPVFSWKGSPGNRTPWLSIDGVEKSAIVPQFLDPQVTSSPRAYGQTAYASLIRDVAAGKTKLDSDMLMYYGGADEGSPDSVATIIDTWQRGTYGKTNIEQVRVPYASHRSTLVTAAFGQLDWFNSKRSVQ